jgi:DNA-binding transcriptional LysR family regulator
MMDFLVHEEKIMNIQHLKYFISVAEHLNFTKAAEDHHIAQPSMSQIIASLEKQLNAKLFIRNNRTVALTPAGKVFYEEAKVITAKFDEAVKKAQLVTSGVEGTLRIGYWGPYEQILIPKLLGRFHRTYPKIELTITQDNNKALIEQLEKEVIDVVFSSPYPFQGREDISCTLLDTSAQCVVVDKNHALAQEKKISPKRLNQEKLVLLDMQDPQDYIKLLKDFERNGFEPNIVSRPVLYNNLIMMVESGIGITLLPRCLEPYTSPELCFIDLESDMTIDFCVSWLKNSQNPCIPLLQDIIFKEYPSAINQQNHKTS